MEGAVMLNKTRKNGTTRCAIVAGLGRNAIASATYLLDAGWDVEAADIRSNPYLEEKFRSALPSVNIHVPLEPENLLHADLVVLSSTPAANAKIGELAVQYDTEVLNSLDLFFQCRRAESIAIAGTNGKSTVSSIVESIISHHGGQVSLGGCRALPFAELLNGGDVDVHLIELSAFHLEQVRSIDADIGVLLNVCPEHNESYEDFDEYAQIMGRAINRAKYAVINRDDPVIYNMIPEATDGRNHVSFGLNRPSRKTDYGIVDDDQGRWIVRGEDRLLNVNDCVLAAAHREANLLAACAVADAAGYPVDNVKVAVEKFPGLPYRYTEEGNWNGVRWINDARSDNVGASIAAIEAGAEPVVLITGGVAAGADFTEIPQQVNGKLRGCVVFGKDQIDIARRLSSVAKLEQADDICQAIKVAQSIAKEGDRVVFSPGCMSFDMFTDYEHRGKTFRDELHIHFDEYN